MTRAWKARQPRRLRTRSPRVNYTEAALLKKNLKLGSTMKTAAIVLSSWKLKIFKKHLDDAGFNYRKFDGPGCDCMTLKVNLDPKDFSKLNNLVHEMDQAAANSKLN